jgi:hypothetical protein
MHKVQLTPFQDSRGTVCRIISFRLHSPHHRTDVLDAIDRPETAIAGLAARRQSDNGACDNIPVLHIGTGALVLEQKC